MEDQRHDHWIGEHGPFELRRENDRNVHATATDVGSFVAFLETVLLTVSVVSDSGSDAQRMTLTADFGAVDLVGTA